MKFGKSRWHLEAAKLLRRRRQRQREKYKIKRSARRQAAGIDCLMSALLDLRRRYTNSKLRSARPAADTSDTRLDAGVEFECLIVNNLQNKLSRVQSALPPVAGIQRFQCLPLGSRAVERTKNRIGNEIKTKR